MLDARGTRRPADGAGEARGAGDAADGRVSAVAVGGRLESLKLDPRVLRMASEELAGHIVAAVNAALDDLATQAPSADQISLPEPRVLAAQVAEIQQQSVRQMMALSQAIGTAVRRVQEAT
jgi:hypothetical protein